MSFIFYKGGYRYQLNERYEVHTGIRPPEGKSITTRYICLFKSGLLLIREGYAWDGPSGPTIHTKSFMRGSLEHDALYQLIRLGLLPQSYREAADQRLRQVCLEDGMWPIRAAWVYQAVRTFGAKAAELGSERMVQTAPFEFPF